MSVICDQFFDCDDKGLTPEDVLRKLIRTDANGCPAINVKVVTASESTCETYITCDNQSLTWKDLALLLVGVDENGCPALKIIDSTP